VTYATGINVAHVVVGYQIANGSPARAWVLVDGAIQWLPTLGGDGDTLAWAINDFDVVTGQSVNAQGEHRAFRFEHGVMRPLTGLETGRQFADTGYAVNAGGVIVGKCATTAVLYVACQWGPGSDGRATSLGALPGDPGSLATAINAQGVVVGLSGDARQQRAVVWLDGATPQDLATLTALPPGVTLREAYAVDDRGWILVDGADEGVEHRYLLEPVASP
jgi:uncharacterized membrane protein